MKILYYIFEKKPSPKTFEQNPANFWNHLYQLNAGVFPHIIYRSDVYISHSKIILVESDQNIIRHTIAFVYFIKIEFIECRQR